MPTTAPSESRLEGLDVLRGIAILLVFMRHAVEVPEFLPGWAASLWAAGVRGGWVGVDLFFVLSGFLVSGLLFNEYARHGAIRPMRFLIRRGLKIYPGFYTMLLFAVAWHALVVCTEGWPRASLWEALFVQNYGAGLWPHTWSLAVEEHFYILLALFLYLLVRRGPRPDPFAHLVRWYVALALGCLALRLHVATAPYAEHTHHFPTHLRADALFAGVLLSYLHVRHREAFLRACVRFRLPFALAGAALFAPFFLFEVSQHPWMYTIGFPALSLGAAFFIAASLVPRAPPGLGCAWRTLARIGFYSYSIYLWHVPVRDMAARWVLGHVWPPIATEVYLLAYVAGALTIGIGMARLVELPMLRLRDRWFPSRARHLTPQGMAAP